MAQWSDGSTKTGTTRSPTTYLQSQSWTHSIARQQDNKTVSNCQSYNVLDINAAVVAAAAFAVVVGFGKSS